MKTTLTSLILFTIFSLNTIAQDTSQWGLPEGAKARLGIGRGSIYDVKYCLDGTRLTAASSSGVWLYDLATGDAVALMRQGNSFSATSVAFSPDGRTLASADNDGTVLLWEIIPEIENIQDDEPSQVTADVNRDEVVDIWDLLLVAARLSQSAENLEDVNEDGIVNIPDLVLVAGMIDNVTVALPTNSDTAAMLRAIDVKQWLESARLLALADVTSLKGIEYLQNLLDALTPERTTLLPNYPNPFNPETWIPYHLARDSVVRISIYDVKGVLVRQLDLGLQPGGYYTDKHHAAYWDGRNDSGELLASGVYVYKLRAGSYRGARRMAFVR